MEKVYNLEARNIGWDNSSLRYNFFMLNSAEHEIFSSNKYENANNGWHFHVY